MDEETFYRTYQDIRMIGKGGIGVIYRAYHVNLGKYVVLKKIILKEYAQIGRHEVDILKNLRHRHLPQVYDFFSVGQTWFMAEDYIQGRSLEEYICAAQRPSQEVIVKWLGQMCDVLDYLHTRRQIVIHCDIKPGNIMIDQYGDICLIDFNISLLYGKDSKLLGYSSHYSSPEQRQQAYSQKNHEKQYRKVDTRSDIYSMGAVFYTLMTSMIPNEKRVIPLMQLQLPYSGQLLTILDTCMERDIRRRYQNVKQVRRELQQMKNRTIRWKRYKKLRLCLCTLGTILVVCGVLGIVEGMQMNTEEAFRAEYQSISGTYRNQGSTQELRDQAAEMLSDNTYRRLWKKYPDRKAELLAMEGEYYYQQDTDTSYIMSADYYRKALDCLQEAQSTESMREYALNYVAALAMSGQETLAEQAVVTYLGSDDQNARTAVEIEAAYSQGEYETVLELCESMRICPDKTIRSKVFAIASAAAQQLGKWDTAVEWCEALAEADTSDENFRRAAQTCLAAGEMEYGNYSEQAADWYERIRNQTAADMLGLAQAQYQLGKYSLSIRTLQGLQTNDLIEQYRMRYYMSLNQAQLGDMEAAQTSCLKAVDCYSSMTQQQKTQIDVSLLQALNEQLGTGKVVRE